jgi:predicted DNA-binding protein
VVLACESECVTNRLMIRDAHLSVRVPADLKQALEKLAATEQRTLASYVHFVLHQHVEKANKSRK